MKALRMRVLQRETGRRFLHHPIFLPRRGEDRLWGQLSNHHVYACWLFS